MTQRHSSTAGKDYCKRLLLITPNRPVFICVFVRSAVLVTCNVMCRDVSNLVWEVERTLLGHKTRHVIPGGKQGEVI